MLPDFELHNDLPVLRAREREIKSMLTKVGEASLIQQNPSVQNLGPFDSRQQAEKLRVVISTLG